MKFTNVILALFAAYSAAAPVAEAKAEAVAEAEAAADPTFLSLLFLKKTLFSLHGSCRDNNDDYPIYIGPDGCLTYGNSVSGSVPFAGTVINGVFYADFSSVNNGLGCVDVNDDGKLQIVNKGKVSWSVNGGTISPQGKSIVCCPDSKGNKYLYSGISCSGGQSLTLSVSGSVSLSD